MAEEFGYSFFKNGALPLVIFQFMAGAAGFKDPNQQRQFVQDFQEALGGNNRHKALLLPKNIDVPKTVPVEHDKAQFIETRKHQRTVIAGAFGVPPHLVGDLEQAHYNNVEQQDKDFTVNVVLPVAQAFEAAMERDLLTREDRAAGIIIRFNLDSVLRADFKSRQEGLRLQRESGVISANEWREMEGMNPLSPEDGGDDYIRPMNMATPGEEPETTEDQDDAENANPDAT
jgi:HK97 family phage portal protein